MVTSDLIAALSLTVSFGTLFWTYRKDKKDQPALQVSATIVNEYDPFGYDTKKPEMFSLYMVNTGNRRIYLRGWYMRQEKSENTGLLFSPQTLPSFLEPAEHHTERVKTTAFLNDSITAIYVSDSLNKEWGITDDNLKLIIKQAGKKNNA